MTKEQLQPTEGRRVRLCYRSPMGFMREEVVLDGFMTECGTVYAKIHYPDGRQSFLEPERVDSAWLMEPLNWEEVRTILHNRQVRAFDERDAATSKEDEDRWQAVADEMAFALALLDGDLRDVVAKTHPRQTEAAVPAGAR